KLQHHRPCGSRHAGVAGALSARPPGTGADSTAKLVRKLRAMIESMAAQNTNARQKVDAVYRSESRRVLATLIRLLGDFDLAEEALHDAFTSAMEQWPRDGVPANPRTWLISAGRFKAIDAMRRRAKFDASLEDIAERLNSEARDPAAQYDEGIEDDRLRLMFTSCHPALSPEVRVALTLREVCGLTTEEIA